MKSSRRVEKRPWPRRGISSAFPSSFELDPFARSRCARSQVQCWIGNGGEWDIGFKDGQEALGLDWPRNEVDVQEALGQD